MALDPITNTTGAANLQAAGISQQDFLKILLTQLTDQDPLKPMDNTQFVAQLAQFSQLEQTQQLSDTVHNSLTTQTASQAVSLLGRTITTNTGLSGLVTAVDFSGATPTLTLNVSGSSSSGIALSSIIGTK
ncbi:MAG TPA: flagellar hook capping FlgD N-terminal domain-containing protein [Burkholderiaceae bacterium]